MRSRLIILVFAIALGLLAAVLVGQYLSSLERGVAAEDEPIDVLVAQEGLRRGAVADDLFEAGMIAIESIPRRYVAEGAVYSVANISGQVLSSEVSAGEQITRARFAFPSKAGLAFSIPEDYVAVSIPNDPVKGVAGMVRPGDHVMVVVTFDPGPDTDALSQVLIDRARVLAIGSSIGAELDSPQGEGETVLGGRDAQQDSEQIPGTITLALSPADVERLVFAEEKGNVWLALLGSVETDVTATSGQTLQSVLSE